MIDNYDSFVYNIVRYFRELEQEICVYRNDEISTENIDEMKLKGIILSPGPKTPGDAILCKTIVKKYAGKIPILGICLGHQVIASVFGGNVVKGNKPVHGKISKVKHDGKGLFLNIKQDIKVTRYHSLEVEKESLPNCLEVSSLSDDGVIMGIRHKEYFIEGVQFHPEAALTECGHAILSNYIKLCRKCRSD